MEFGRGRRRARTDAYGSLGGWLASWGATLVSLSSALSSYNTYKIRSIIIDSYKVGMVRRPILVTSLANSFSSLVLSTLSAL